MSKIHFSKKILDLFPSHTSDLHELEDIFEKHQLIQVCPLLLPERGPNFLKESILCRMLTFAFTATIRSERLLESIIKCFNDFNLHAVYVLVRSHLELAALTHFAKKNLEEMMSEKKLDELDAFLEKLVLGNLYMSKQHRYPIKPFHIGSVVRELEEISPKIPQMYYFLSEFTHPNMGALVLSATLDKEKGITEFDRHRAPQETDYMQTINIVIATGELTLKDVGTMLMMDVSDLA